MQSKRKTSALLICTAMVGLLGAAPVVGQGLGHEPPPSAEHSVTPGESLGGREELPQPTEAPTKPPTYTVPVFIIEAISFTAVDETGIDLLGSDEVYATWTSDSHPAYSALFGDVDSGDTRYFHEYQRCMYPISASRVVEAFEGDAWQCRPEGGPGNVSFRVDMYESDAWYGLGCGRSFDGVGAPECNKDWIGGYSVSLTEEELVAMLPNPNQLVDRTVRLERGCADSASDAESEGAPGANLCSPDLLEADYDFQFRITRLADRVMYDHGHLD